MDTIQVACIAIGTLLLYALFSGMEMAFIASNKLRLEIDKQQHGLHSKIITLLTKHPGQLIATTLTGSIITLVTYSLLVAQLFHSLLSKLTDSIAIILVAESILIALILLFTADVIPKAITRTNPNKYLRILSFPFAIFYILLYPITWPLSRLTNTRIKGKNGTTSPFEKHDLLRMADDLAENETDEAEDHKQEMELFRNALEFGEVRVKECMIPRTEINAIDVDSDKVELIEHFVSSGLSRILVYNDSIDNILGYIHTKDLFQKEKNIRELIRPIGFVPENMPAQKLQTLFIKEHKSIAVVVDEFGGTSGLLTIEDIMEEIIGDIDDEHDSDMLVERRISGETYIFSARLEVDYLNEKYHFDIPESDDYETLAGYIIYRNEELPKPKQILTFDGFTIRIIRTSTNRIELVEFTVNR